MGYDCVCYLPRGTNFKEVEEFLGFLGYERLSRGLHYFFEDQDYLSTTGVSAMVQQDDDELTVSLRSNIQASKTDIDQFNFTAKQLRKRFGGHFISDFGKGRYIRVDKPDLRGSKAGCYLAHMAFENNISTMQMYLENVRFDIQFPPIGQLPYVDEFNPIIVSNNLLVPFLVSTVEEFFKSCYVAILKYSPRKEIVIKNSRLFPDDLSKIGDGQTSLEEGIARTKSFQNADKIHSNFKEVDLSIDIYGELTRPYRRRKTSLFESLSSLFDHRNLLIHRNSIDSSYTRQKLTSDISNIEVIVERVIEHFADKLGWDE
jgi:hypothetical protein